MGFVLTPEQLAAFTGRRRCDAQRRELEHMRIRFRARSDGSLAVLLADLSPEAQATIVVEEPELTPKPYRSSRPIRFVGTTIYINKKL